MREMRGARSRLSGEPVERRLNFDVSVAFPSGTLALVHPSRHAPR